MGAVAFESSRFERYRSKSDWDAAAAEIVGTMLLEQLGTPFRRSNPAALLEERLLEATRIVGCDPARTARWCFARCALTLSWQVEDGDVVSAEDTLLELKVWATILG